MSMRRTVLSFAGISALSLALASGGPSRRAHAQTAEEGELSAAEQYMVEIVNRSRADPDAEAARMGIDLNEGLAAGTLTNEAREPLAVNLCLSEAAQLHTRDLFQNFTQLPPDHRGSDGKDPTGRATAAGAVFIGGVAENNAWATQGDTRATASSVLATHRLLFRDFTPTFEVVGRGHRKVMLNGTRNEIGVGLQGGQFGGKTAAVVTYDLITSNTNYITGVAIADTVKRNQFYDIGEGLGGVTITAVQTSGGSGTFTTTTQRAGGYSLPVPDGTFTVTATGGGLGAPVEIVDVVVAGANVKVDVIVAKAYAPPKPRGFSVTKGLAKLSKGGTWSFQVKQAALSFGTLGLTPAEADQFTLEVDGATFFALGDRVGGVDKRTIDADLGLVRKLTLKDASKNKAVLDLVKGTLVVTLKSVPEFLPTGETVQFVVRNGTDTATVTLPSVEKNSKTRTLGPAEGSLSD